MLTAFRIGAKRVSDLILRLRRLRRRVFLACERDRPRLVMPGPVPASTSSKLSATVVDGRDKPGHDGELLTRERKVIQPKQRLLNHCGYA
jgi:hypothetical protein